MKIKIKNIWRVLKDQGPPQRFFKNWVVTRNAWGLFSPNSHIAAYSGQPKIMYKTKESSLRAAEGMKKKHGVHFSSYKCLWCDGFHIGKNSSNKKTVDSNK
jgi:hypothetical protein